jgi:acetyl esterase/lipase
MKKPAVSLFTLLLACGALSAHNSSQNQQKARDAYRKAAAGFLLLAGVTTMPKTSKPPAAQNKQPTAAEMVRMPLVYRLPGMENARIHKDLVYRTVGKDELKMDVYGPGPGGPAGPRPALVFIHGGPIPAPPVMQPKEWAVYQDYGKLAAAAGFVGVTFNHRYHGYDKQENAQGDIDAAVEFLRGHAADLGVDAERLGIWAFSGGGSFLASTLRKPPAYIRAVAGFYVILDMRPYLKMDRSGSEALFEKFSPAAALDQARAHLPPLFIGRAGLDNALINSGTDGFVAAALKKNISLVLWNHPTGYHGFDIRNDDPTSREMIREALAFFKAHLD